MTHEQRYIAHLWFRALRDWREYRPPTLPRGGPTAPSVINAVTAAKGGGSAQVQTPVGLIDGSALRAAILAQPTPNRELLEIILEAPAARATGATLPRRLLRRDGRYSGERTRLEGFALACLALAAEFHKT